MVTVKRLKYAETSIQIDIANTNAFISILCKNHIRVARISTKFLLVDALRATALSIYDLNLQRHVQLSILFDF
jgi:hypothetical protein